MKYLRQLAILFAFCIFGDVLSVLFGGAMPGNVLGLTLLFLCLAIGIIRINHIEKTADFFLNNMAFFFLPACLGILDVFSQISQYLFPILAVILLTTLLTATATSLTVHGVLRLQEYWKVPLRKKVEE